MCAVYSSFSCSIRIHSRVRLFACFSPLRVLGTVARWNTQAVQHLIEVLMRGWNDSPNDVETAACNLKSWELQEAQAACADAWVKARAYAETHADEPVWRFVLGYCVFHERGGGSEEQEAAAPHLQLAATSGGESGDGLANALFLLAGCTFRGVGVEPDAEQAFALLRRAAERGHAQAQFMLGAEFYAKGNLVDQDSALALAWCRKAAAQGFEPAAEMVSELLDAE